MANTTYVTDKLFLDQSGLQALIAKIAKVNTDLKAFIQEVRDKLPYEAFEETVKKYIDDADAELLGEIKKVSDKLPYEAFGEKTVKEYIDDADDKLQGDIDDINDLIGTDEGVFSADNTISTRFAEAWDRFEEVIKFVASPDGSLYGNEKLGRFINQDTTESTNANNGSILSQIVNFAADLRDELGDWANANITSANFDNEADFETVTSALTAIVAKIDSIINDANSLEDRVAKLEGTHDASVTTTIEHDGAFVKVTADQDNNSQNIDVKFFNSYGKEVGGFEIDTADFIMHGMLSDVRSVVLDRSKLNDPEYSWVDQSMLPASAVDGNHYLVFTFEVSHEQEASSDIHEYKQIWVDVSDLYTDYTFETEAGEYFTFTAERTNAGKNDEAQNFLFTLNATAKLTDAVDAVYGGQDLTTDKGYSGTNIDKHGAEKSRGVYALDNALLTAEAKIADLDEAEKADRKCINRIEEVIGLTHSGDHADGYEDAKGTVSDRLQTLEWWTMERSISVDYLDYLWDKIVGKVDGDDSAILTPDQWEEYNG